MKRKGTQITRRNIRLQPDQTALSYFRNTIVRWYAINGRSFPWRCRSANIYYRIVSEVLLQRTRAETVAAFAPDFIRAFPNWKALGTASISKLRAHLRPIGIWRRRADSLRNLGVHICRRGGHLPSRKSEIYALPNVGQYIGNAIILFWIRKPAPLLDGSMARLLERFFGPRELADLRHDSFLQVLAHRVVLKRPIVTNWALLDFAALVCSPRPRCSECPVASKCRFYLEHRL